MCDSEFLPYDRVKKEGFWRSLMVRNHFGAQTMAVIQVNPTAVEAEQIQQEKDRLVEFFKGLDVTSLYMQVFTMINGRNGRKSQMALVTVAHLKNSMDKTISMNSCWAANTRYHQIHFSK